MSAISNTGIRRGGGAGAPSDSVGIYSIPEQHETPLIGLMQLDPAEAKVSMPSEQIVSGGNPLSALTQFIGAALTVGSPAWSGDPVPTMRGLQKKLVEHSLTLDEKDRSPCMAAISVVEDTLQWRLRLQQMRMNDVERDIEDQARKAKTA